jgi:hypothetical protein
MAEEHNNEEVADYQDDGLYDETETYNHEGGEGDGVEPEDFNARVQEMEDELEQVTKLQQQVEKELTSASDKIDENSM